MVRGTVAEGMVVRTAVGDRGGVVGRGGGVVSRSGGIVSRSGVGDRSGVVGRGSDQRSVVRRGDDRGVHGRGSDDWCVDGRGGDHRGDDAWLVDHGGGWVLGLDAWFVGLDVGTETEVIGDVVDDSETTVSVSETVRADLVAVAVALFTSEGAAGGVVLIVTESVVTQVVLRSELGRVSRVDEGSVVGHGDDVCRGDGDETEKDQALHC